MMNGIYALVLDNLEKVGIGVVIFLGAYLANIIFGVWNNVKIEGYEFNWRLIGNSIVKFIVLGVGIALLTVLVSLIPMYAQYVGIEIEAETLSIIDSLVIVGGFLTATIRYVKDSLNKLSNILGNN